MTVTLVLALALAADLSPAAKSWWKHVEFLADDKLEGRDTGSKGHKMAVDYAAQEFEKAGVQPGGEQGYFQTVPFNVRKIDESKSSIKIIRDGKTEDVTLGREAAISMRIDPKPEVTAEAVFIGYGFAIPEINYDDISGIDLKGKIAVYISGVPEGVSAELSAHYQSAGERWKQLKAAGAVGIIAMQNPKNADIPWARSSRARLLPSMDLADPVYDETKGTEVSITWNAERAQSLFAGSGHTIEELLKLSSDKKRLPRFPLKGKIQVKTAVERSSIQSQNVVGVLPGSDPKLKNEFVVLSAHIDHIGKSPVIEGDAINNGAMDNAAGIASMIEIARMFKAQGVKPKRSIAFVAVTGEEKGLRGSRWFATHPTVKGKMVANLNMDMFLPIHKLEVLRVLGLNESDLGDTMRAAAEKAGIRVQTDPQPERNAFIRSDQYNFVRVGVPAINAGFGYTPGSPEEKIHKDWLTERYHGVTDDLSQPVDQESAAKFNAILFDFVNRVADQPNAPQWKETSFFKRFEKK